MNMFYVPAILIQCKDWDDKKKKIERIYEKQKPYFRYNSDDCSTDFFSIKDNVNLNWKDHVADIFFEELLSLKKQLNLSTAINLQVKASWFEIANHGDCHNAHTHGNSGYSAVCYIEYSPDLHTPTIFISPFKNFLDGSDLEFTPKDIKEGSLIFFPSSIYHYTKPNRSKIPRKILSFNLALSEHYV